jgi:hypothetical protein
MNGGERDGVGHEMIRARGGEEKKLALRSTRGGKRENHRR